MADFAFRPYKNVPDSLMGFRKRGQNKGYNDTNYKHEQKVTVHFPASGDKWEDAIKGINKGHALERAHRNWPGAEIEPIDN